MRRSERSDISATCGQKSAVSTLRSTALSNFIPVSEISPDGWRRRDTETICPFARCVAPGPMPKTGLIRNSNRRGGIEALCYREAEMENIHIYEMNGKYYGYFDGKYLYNSNGNCSHYREGKYLYQMTGGQCEFFQDGKFFYTMHGGQCRWYCG